VTSGAGHGNFAAATCHDAGAAEPVMGRPAGLEARAGRRDQRSFPMNASARTEMEAEAGSSVHFK
jgi:hypothetical protein